jgi:hypothetical protein
MRVAGLASRGRSVAPAYLSLNECVVPEFRDILQSLELPSIGRTGRERGHAPAKRPL